MFDITQNIKIVMDTLQTIKDNMKNLSEEELKKLMYCASSLFEQKFNKCLGHHNYVEVLVSKANESKDALVQYMNNGFYDPEDDQILFRCLDNKRNKNIIIFLIEKYGFNVNAKDSLSANMSLFEWLLCDYTMYDDKSYASVYREIAVELIKKFGDMIDINYIDDEGYCALSVFKHDNKDKNSIFIANWFVEKIKMGKIDIYNCKNILKNLINYECTQLLDIMFEFDLSPFITDELFEIMFVKNCDIINQTKCNFIKRIMSNEKYSALIADIAKNKPIDIVTTMIEIGVDEDIIIRILEFSQNEIRNEINLISPIMDARMYKLAKFVLSRPFYNFEFGTTFTCIRRHPELLRTAFRTILNNDRCEDFFEPELVKQWILSRDFETCDLFFRGYFSDKYCFDIDSVDNDNNSFLMLILKNNIFPQKEDMSNPTQRWIDLSMALIEKMSKETVTMKNKSNETAWDIANQLKIIPMVEKLIGFDF